jgi:hypothetical protein
MRYVDEAFKLAQDIASKSPVAIHGIKYVNLSPVFLIHTTDYGMCDSSGISSTTPETTL